MSEVYKRAEMPRGAQAVLDERTLAASNANLLQVLSDGQRVLDVGCGSGAITQGMAALVGPSGSVRGVDRSKELIDEARQRYGAVAGLSFDCADVLTFAPEPVYDVVTAARTLQWVAQPEHFLRHLMALARRRRHGQCYRRSRGGHDETRRTTHRAARGPLRICFAGDV